MTRQALLAAALIKNLFHSPSNVGPTHVSFVISRSHMWSSAAPMQVVKILVSDSWPGEGERGGESLGVGIATFHTAGRGAAEGGEYATGVGDGKGEDKERRGKTGWGGGGGASNAPETTTPYRACVLKPQSGIPHLDTGTSTVTTPRQT